MVTDVDFVDGIWFLSLSHIEKSFMFTNRSYYIVSTLDGRQLGDVNEFKCLGKWLAIIVH